MAFFLLFWGLVLIYHKVRADADIDIKGDIAAGRITTGSAGLLLVFFSVIVMLYVALTKFEMSQSSTGTTSVTMLGIPDDFQQLRVKLEALEATQEELKLLKQYVGALSAQIQELRLILKPVLITDNMPQAESPCPDNYHPANVASNLEQDHDFNQDGIVCKPRD